MGVCASSQYTDKNGSLNWALSPSTAKIIHWDGSLQEFRHPIKASHIIALNPNFFLCSSEFMYLDSHVPHVLEYEELQLGQVYFLIPYSKFQAPLSLQDLGSLAIKATSALVRYSKSSTKIIHESL